MKFEQGGGELLQVCYAPKFGPVAGLNFFDGLRCHAANAMQFSTHGVLLLHAMNLQIALKSIFPEGDVLFRAGCPFEVVGLKAGSLPKNCDILAQFLEKTPPRYRREHFLVRADEVTLYFRICSGSPAYGSEEFVVGVGHANLHEHHNFSRQVLAGLNLLTAASTV